MQAESAAAAHVFARILAFFSKMQAESAAGAYVFAHVFTRNAYKSRLNSPLIRPLN